MLGQVVTLEVDQPIGSHCAACRCYAALNFGHIAAPDSHVGQLAYLIDVYEPVQRITGRVIARIQRPEQQEPLWVVEQGERVYYGCDIVQAIAYQESAFGSDVIPLFDKSCGGIVIYQGSSEPLALLLHSQKHGYWGFPKGHVEVGESEEATTYREILEETGLDVRLLGEYRGTINLCLPEGTQKELVLRLALCEDKEVTLSSEHQGYCWIPLRDVASKLSFSNDRQVFLEAMRIYQSECCDS